MPLRLAADVAMEVIDDEAVLLDLTSGRYFGANEVAARFLELLRNGEEEQAIHTTLRSEFSVDPATLSRDLETLVGDLVAEGLLVQE